MRKETVEILVWNEGREGCEIMDSIENEKSFRFDSTFHNLRT